MKNRTPEHRGNTSSLSAVCSVINYDPYMPSCAVFFWWYVCLHTTKSNHATNKSSTSIPSFVSEYRFERIFSIRNPCENTRYPSNIKQINRVFHLATQQEASRSVVVTDGLLPNRGVVAKLLVYTMIWLFPKIGGFPPKWMVKIMEKPYEQMDDLGGETHHLRKHPYGE